MWELRASPRIWVRRLLPLSLGAATWGCPATNDLTIRARDENGRPLAGLAVTVLPVDADRILHSLEATASTPRPRFPELEAAMAGYRRRERPAFAERDRAWLATRDSLQQLADSLRRINRASPAYREGYNRLRALYSRLGKLTLERDQAARSLVQSDRDLAQRAARAADSLRRWERTAFAAFPDLLTRAVAASGREPHQLVLDSSGQVTVTVGPGRWWLYARLPDAENPFQEFYWNVTVTTNRWVPTVALISSQNAQRRWRH